MDVVETTLLPEVKEVKPACSPVAWKLAEGSDHLPLEGRRVNLANSCVSPAVGRSLAILGRGEDPQAAGIG